MLFHRIRGAGTHACRVETRLDALLFFCIPLLLTLPLHSAVRSIEITERAPVLNGQTFGPAGAYERIVGKVHFALDPKLPANQIVRDLRFAAADSSGLVECTADFYMFTPADPAKGNGTVLLEVSNRGGKGMLSRFDFARGGDEFGDKSVLEQGYTLVWLGWEWDIPASNRTALHFSAPHFRSEALPADGLVSSEFVADRTVTSFSLGDRNQDPISVGRAIGLYAADDLGHTKPIAAAKWKLSADGKSVEMPSGFEPGQLYEFVYQGKDPVVAGTGLAAIRDWISYLKYGGGAKDAGSDLARIGKRSIGFGISQSGRFLREFLYDGFNADEQGRKVFDGIWADVGGGGRGSFNFRYAQPSRDGWPFLNVFYFTDVFPFTDAVESDPNGGQPDGLLARARAANVVPKLFLTNNSSEYWGRAAALIHTSAEGLQDVSPAPDTRVYFLAGDQHTPGSLPLRKSGARYPQNPVDHRPVQRALLAAMQAWIAAGAAPPPSVYPRIQAGQLTRLEGLKFPAIPDQNAPAPKGVVTPPQHPRLARRLDFGRDFDGMGIIGKEPPEVKGAYPLLVPQVDADGIDLGGIRLPEVAVPVATITGWNLRAPERGSPEESAEFYGSIFPFAKTREDRERTKDPRPSIAERYPSREDYLKRVEAAADDLIARRFLLPQDRSYAIDRAARLWDALQ